MLEPFQCPKRDTEMFENIFQTFSGVRGTYRTILFFDSGSPLRYVLLKTRDEVNYISYFFVGNSIEAEGGGREGRGSTHTQICCMHLYDFPLNKL